jgi:glutamyl-tRNA reductase
MSPDQEMAVEALTRGIINKIMHTPISTLKTAARDQESTTVVELVRRLFNLEGEEQEGEEQEREKEKRAAASKSGGDPDSGASH